MTKHNSHITKGLSRPCNAGDLFIVSDGLQCGNCMELIVDNASNRGRFAVNHARALASLGFIGSYLTLRRLELKAHRLAEQWCNGYISEPMFDDGMQVIINKLSKLFDNRRLPAGFFINSDPRGYALKLDNERATIPEGMYTDWGGYGIFAPEED